MPDQDAYTLTIRQAARQLGVSEKTIRRYIKSGTLDKIIVQGQNGPEYRILPASLEKLGGQLLRPLSRDYYRLEDESTQSLMPISEALETIAQDVRALKTEGHPAPLEVQSLREEIGEVRTLMDRLIEAIRDLVSQVETTVAMLQTIERRDREVDRLREALAQREKEVEALQQALALGKDTGSSTEDRRGIWWPRRGLRGAKE